jgi:hypothetical protein
MTMGLHIRLAWGQLILRVVHRLVIYTGLRPGARDDTAKNRFNGFRVRP